MSTTSVAVRVVSTTGVAVRATPETVGVQVVQTAITPLGAVPVGPQGPSGAGDSDAHGEVLVANLTWVMQHDLDIAAADFNPSDWWFEDETGVPMEPIEIHHVTDNIASAEWLLPVRGTWRL